MADYYSLIKNAVARLDSSASRESRRAIYERARGAQLAQLRSISPPLAESEITREQLALEEAVRRVEAEVTQLMGDAWLKELVTAADEIGKPSAGPRGRASVVRAKAPADPLSPASAPEMLLPMIVRGNVIGRLVKYWRWRALPPPSAGSKRVGGR